MSDDMNQKLTQAVTDSEPDQAEVLAKQAKFIEEIGKPRTFVLYQLRAPRPFDSLGNFSRKIE